MIFNKQDLIDFEKEVITEWEKGETYGPIHLSGGNEDQLINIFKNIKKNDWIFSTHRSHYHALLKSKDKKWLMKEIIVKSNSSHINSKKYKIFTSAIVGGNIPIALGVALAMKRKKKKNHVWCFVGDMASKMGGFHEAVTYALGQDLPITFIIENNRLGCETPTTNVWNKKENIVYAQYIQGHMHNIGNHTEIINYRYERKYPHVGTGKWLKFKKKFKSTGGYDAFK